MHYSLKTLRLEKKKSVDHAPYLIKHLYLPGSEVPGAASFEPFIILQNQIELVLSFLPFSLLFLLLICHSFVCFPAFKIFLLLSPLQFFSSVFLCLKNLFLEILLVFWARMTSGVLFSEPS